MIFIRIIGSWFPNLQRYRLMHMVHFYTEPYLGLFRKIIPPIGGVLDLSPLIAIFSLNILKSIILSVLV